MSVRETSLPEVKKGVAAQGISLGRPCVSMACNYSRCSFLVGSRFEDETQKTDGTGRTGRNGRGWTDRTRRTGRDGTDGMDGSDGTGRERSETSGTGRGERGGATGRDETDGMDGMDGTDRTHGLNSRISPTCTRPRRDRFLQEHLRGARQERHDKKAGATSEKAGASSTFLATALFDARGSVL